MSSWGTSASYSETSCEFFIGFFFFQSDRPNQYQETHSTLNEKKRGMALRKWKLKRNKSTVLKGNDSLQYQYNYIYDYMKIDHFSHHCFFFCTGSLSTFCRNIAAQFSERKKNDRSLYSFRR